MNVFSFEYKGLLDGIVVIGLSMPFIGCGGGRQWFTAEFVIFGNGYTLKPLPVLKCECVLKPNVDKEILKSVDG